MSKAKFFGEILGAIVGSYLKVTCPADRRSSRRGKLGAALREATAVGNEHVPLAARQCRLTADRTALQP